MEPRYEQVPIAEAAGAVGLVQVAVGVVVLAYAAWLALRRPVQRRGVLVGAGLVAAFVPVVIGHVVMLVAQVRVLHETGSLPPDAAQRTMVRGMESATVHTWIGWTASGVAFLAVLGARWLCRRSDRPR
jgi:hypothetical protein